MKKKSSWGTLLSNVILFFFVLFFSYKILENSFQLSIFYDNKAKEVELDLSANNLLEALIVSDWLRKKLSSLDFNNSIYYMEYNTSSRRWELKKNNINLDDVKDKIKRMYPSNTYYIIKLYNPLDYDKVDYIIEMGRIDVDDIVFNNNNIANNFISTFGGSIDITPNRNSYPVLFSIKDPSYNKLRIFYYDEYNSSIFYADEKFLVLDDVPVDSLIEIINESIKEKRKYLVINDKLLRNDTLQVFLRDIGIVCRNMSFNYTLDIYGKKIYYKVDNEKICYPTKNYIGLQGLINGTEIYKLYYIPKYKILLIPIPFNDLELNTNFFSYIIYYFYDRYFNRYFKKKYTKYFSFTLYGKLDVKYLIAIGEKEYKHYYTKNVMDKISIEYLVPKEGQIS